MLAFFQNFLSQEFVRNALWAGILAGLACGIMGTYVVVRRISYISGGIAHSILGGMGVALFFQQDPMLGAMAAALLAALLTGLVNLRAREREDVMISAIWSLGMALGVIFISLRPGYGVDLMSYLFGNILMVSPADLRQLMVLDGMILLLVFLFYRQFQAVCFDQEFMRAKGLNAAGVYLLLLCLIALTVVMLIQIVGIVLVIALLTLPAATAGQFSSSLGRMMLAAILISFTVTLGGLGVSYATDLPSGAVIIVITVGFFLAAEALHLIRRRGVSRKIGKPDPCSGV